MTDYFVVILLFFAAAGERITVMRIKEFQQEFVFEEDRDFNSSHASTVLELKDGGILTAFFGGSWEKNPDVAIWTARRINGKWERPRKTADVPGVAMWNPVLFRKKDSAIVLFYKVGADIPHWKTWYMESRDEGNTFSEPKELVPGDESGGRGPVKDKPIRLRSGRILAPASVEGECWDAFTDISDDEMKTWEKSSPVPLKRCGFDISMVDRPYDRHNIYGKGAIQPTLWEDQNGLVHMFLRTTSSRIFRSDSSDGGRTWCTAYDTGLPNNNSGIDLTGLPDGRIVLVCNPRENLPNYYKGPRTPLSVLVSEDNGDSFAPLKVLEDRRGNYCYPAVICNDRQELHITYTWNRERIVYCRIVYED